MNNNNNKYKDTCCYFKSIASSEIEFELKMLLVICKKDIE